MRLLIIVNGVYGERHLSHLRQAAPVDWVVMDWRAPVMLPPVIDYPEEYLPPTLPAADLIVSLAEHKGVAELLPDVARMTGATAVLAPIDNEAWLPRGLARQLRGWLAQMGVDCITPKPLCALTETHYSLGRRQRVAYAQPLVAAVARYFGQPALQVVVDGETGRVTAVSVQRDTFCGCAQFVAAGLVGVSADEAAAQAGLRHHHFPCLASMGIDPDYGDTLMHISGNLLKENVAAQVKPFCHIPTITPGIRHDS